MSAHSRCRAIVSLLALLLAGEGCGLDLDLSSSNDDPRLQRGYHSVSQPVLLANETDETVTWRWREVTVVTRPGEQAVTYLECNEGAPVCFATVPDHVLPACPPCGRGPIVLRAQP